MASLLKRFMDSAPPDRAERCRRTAELFNYIEKQFPWIWKIFGAWSHDRESPDWLEIEVVRDWTELHILTMCDPRNYQPGILQAPIVPQEVWIYIQFAHDHGEQPVSRSLCEPIVMQPHEKMLAEAFERVLGDTPLMAVFFAAMYIEPKGRRTLKIYDGTSGQSKKQCLHELRRMIVRQADIARRTTGED
jgi:hypothetical protein